jgi:hypothetical protein
LANSVVNGLFTCSDYCLCLGTFFVAERKQRWIIRPKKL